MTGEATKPPPPPEEGASELRACVEDLRRAMAELTQRFEIVEKALRDTLGQLPAATGGFKRRLESALPGGSYLVVRVSRRLLGIPLDCVREVVRIVALRPIPDAASFVEGLLDLRGEPVGVVNLRVAFGDERLANDLDCRIVLVELGGQTYGLLTDDVLNAEQIDPRAVDAPPGLTNADYLTGVIRIAGEMVILLEPRRLLDALSLEGNLALEGIDAFHDSDATQRGTEPEA